MGLNISHLDTKDIYDIDGDLESFDDTYRLMALMIDLDYGITSRLQVGFSLPYFTGEIGKAEGSAIGDISANIQYGLLRNPEAFSAAVYLRLSYPSGIHDLKYQTTDDNELVQTSFTTGDPSFNLMPGLALKWHKENWAIEGCAEYVYTFADDIVVEYFLSENVKRDPGDGVNAYISGIYQVRDKFALFIDLSYISRPEGEIDSEDAEDETMSLSLGPRVLYHIISDTDLYLGAQYIMDGINTGAGVPLFIGVSTRF